MAAARDSGYDLLVRRPRGSDYREVGHRAWRDFDAVRRAATNAVAGLGFGLALAQEEAQSRLASSETATFAQAFPNLPGATDFDFAPAKALEELSHAEGSLAQMAIPFAIAIYNEYVVEAVRLHERWRASGVSGAAGSMSLGDLEALLRDSYGVKVSGPQGELLALLAHLRNRIVHFGGRAGERLIELRRGLSDDAEDAWERVAGRAFPTPTVGKPLALRRRDAAAALAVVDHAASELNRSMVTTFSGEFWADIAVEDYVEQFPDAWQRDDFSEIERARFEASCDAAMPWLVSPTPNSPTRLAAPRDDHDAAANRQGPRAMFFRRRSQDVYLTSQRCTTGGSLLPAAVDRLLCA